MAHCDRPPIWMAGLPILLRTIGASLAESRAIRRNLPKNARPTSGAPGTRSATRRDPAWAPGRIAQRSATPWAARLLTESGNPFARGGGATNPARAPRNLATVAPSWAYPPKAWSRDTAGYIYRTTSLHGGIFTGAISPSALWLGGRPPIPTFHDTHITKEALYFAFFARFAPSGAIAPAILALRAVYIWFRHWPAGAGRRRKGKGRGNPGRGGAEAKRRDAPAPARAG